MCRSLGVEVHMDAVVGKLVTIDELLNERGFDAVFLGTGAGLPIFLNVPGANSDRRLFGQRVSDPRQPDEGLSLSRVRYPGQRGQKGGRDRRGQRGDGLGALRAAPGRLAGRERGEEPPEVHIVYRRSRQEVPARAEEVHHAEEEGIIFDFLTNPVEILGKTTGM